MIDGEVEVLNRAHQLFAGTAPAPALDAGTAHYLGSQHRVAPNTPVANGGYRLAAEDGRRRLSAAAGTDAEASRIIASAYRDRARAGELTKSVLDDARADSLIVTTTPMARREAMRRRVARLRAQRAHVASARLQARRHSAALRALHYRTMHRREPGSAGAAAVAVRAALSRLGRPYVWGATGPDQFDCSGLVKWSYAQAGVQLHRTTYQQINDGIPVPRGQIRPGDLVFPHAGHVQLAIGNNLVVEAPYAGAAVRISPLGNNIAIRRPL